MDTPHWQKRKRKERLPIRERLVDGESISLLDDVSMEELFPEGLDWDAVHRVAGTELTEDQVFQKRQSEVDIEDISKQMWKLLAFDSRYPGAEALEWPVNTGEVLIRYNLPPQSLWSTDEMRRKALSSRQTWKKQIIQELSIGYLIHALLSPVASLSDQLPEDGLQSLSQSIHTICKLGPLENNRRRSEILKSMTSIQDQPVDASFAEISRAKRVTRGPGIPQYFQDEDGDYYHICQQMNLAIRQILFGEQNSPIDGNQVSLTLAKVCHNLLVSSSAPDVHTFNILISGLTRWRLSDLVDRVISAFTDCKIRPNEITCVAILDHYLQCNRPEDFSKFVAKMRGVHRGGLMLAKPTITVNERGAKRLIRVSQEKVIQKVYPTPLVFNTLMHGALKFAGCARALDIYYEMKEDGWGLDITGLGHFLDDCISQADWNNGIYIWNEILSIMNKIKPAQKEMAYSKMLSLCSVTGNTAAFNQLLKEVVDQGLNRRFIVKSALVTAQKLHDQPSSMVPPWSADNVLFAIGDYMEDVMEKEDLAKEPVDFEQNYPPQEGSETAKPPSKEPDVAWPSWIQQELTETVQRDYRHAGSEKTSANNPDAAWSSWIQHELAEPVEGNSCLQKESESEKTTAKSPDVAWSSWLEHELKEKTELTSTEEAKAVDGSNIPSNKSPRPRP